MNNKVRTIAVLATISITMSLLLLTGCSGGKGAPAAVPVMAEKAVQKDVPRIITAIGSVEAFTSVTVRTLVGGELQRVHFVEGADARKGDLLFTIDPRPYQAALKQAEADLLRTRARAAAAKAKARRSKDLVKDGYIASQQFEDVTADSDSADADEKAAEAALDNAKLDLQNCSIRAPMDCRTGNVMVKVGNIVKANETELTVLNQIAPVNVSFSVPEQQLDGIRSAMASGKVAVTAVTSSGSPVTGELAFFDNRVDPGTGSILLKATFGNSDKALWPGQFVNLNITLAMIKNAVVIPAEAVQTGQQGEYVFIVKDDMTVAMNPVKSGQVLDGSAVILDGINPGDTVVTDGHLRLKPGSKVEIKGGLENSAGK